MNDFYGLPIRTSPHLTETVTKRRRRTWRERLLRRPWRPLVAFEIETRVVPSTRVLHLGGFLVMHPAMLERLQRELLNRPPDGVGWRPFADAGGEPWRP
jgi:hypothetical protein